MWAGGRRWGGEASGGGRVGPAVAVTTGSEPDAALYMMSLSNKAKEETAMAVFISNDDVRKLLSMPECVEVLEELFRQESEGLVENIPRKRYRFGGPRSATLMGGIALGLRAYGVRHANMALLHDTDTGNLEALIEPGTVAWMRTGAASGVATRHMALADPSVVGGIGPGPFTRGADRLFGLGAVGPVGDGFDGAVEIIHIGFIAAGLAVDHFQGFRGVYDFIHGVFPVRGKESPAVSGLGPADGGCRGKRRECRRRSGLPIRFPSDRCRP